ncbi:thymidine kinase, partial [Klebsiella aerogenes]
LKTICFCGRKASMVLRLDQEGRPYNEGEQVVIGGNERYVSVCRKHYKEALRTGSLTQVQSQLRHCE